MKSNKIFKLIGGLLITAFLLSGTAFGAAVTISISGITKNTGGAVPTGAYVQVIQSDDATAGDPSQTTGLPQGDTVKVTGSINPDGTFQGAASITANKYVYIRVWQTWNGAGAPSGYWGTSAPENVGAGFVYTYDPAGFPCSSTFTPPTPNITSITWQIETDEKLKNKNYVYGVIEITGSNFGSDPGNGNRDTASNKVTLGGTVVIPDLAAPQEGVMEVYSWSSGTIVAGIPLRDEAGTNYVIAGNLPVVVTAGGLASNSDKTIEVKPRVYSLDKTSGAVGTIVTFNGNAYGTTAGNITVSFNGTNATAASANNTTFTVAVPSGATTGTVSVTLNGKTTNTYENGSAITFTVITPPAVSSTSPASRPQGWSGNVTINGTGFQNGATSSFGSGITVNSTTFVSSTQLTANITITGGATPGTRDVTVTNPDTGSGTGTDAFSVNALPTVASVSPNSQVQGWSGSVIITGTGFQNGAASNFGSGITVNSTTFDSSTQLTANISIAGGATPGTRNVTVTNPDSGSAVGTSIFIVGTLPAITKAYNKQEGESAHYVYVTQYDPDWEGTPDNTLNLIVEGANFGENSSDYTKTDNQTAPTGSSIAVKPFGFASFQNIPDDPANPPDRMYWWQKDKIEIGIPDKFGTAPVAAGAAKLKVTTPTGSTSEQDFAVKPQIDALSSTSGPAGSKIAITGTAFGASAGNISVSFNGTATQAATAAGTTIEVYVPSGATTGPLMVTVNSQASNTNYKWGSNDAITFTVTQAPTVPTGLSESNITQTSARVSWEASATATSYTVSYGTDEAASNAGEIASIIPTYQDLSTLTINTKYYWKVRAFNDAGGSAYSTIDNFTTLPATPETPTGLSESNITKNSARVSWNAVSGAASYTISYGTDASASNKGEIASITDAYKDLSSLTAETKFYWKVKAVNAGGSSAYSTIPDFTTLAEAPSISKVYNKGLKDNEAKEESWVYVTQYDPNWQGTPDYYLNLVLAGSSFGEKTASGSSEAPSGGSVAVKPFGFSEYQTINDDASNPPDRLYWWQKDKIEIGIPDKLSNSFVVAGSAKVRITTSGGSTEESFAVKPKAYGITWSAKTGEKIKITGTAFGTDTNNITVKFNDVATQPATAANTTLEVIVPEGAATGKVTVVVNGQTSNSLDFIVLDTPVLGVEPASLSFTAVQDSANPAAQALSVKNVGKGKLTWQAAKTKTWLTVTPASGETGADESSTLTISVKIAGVAAGTYNDTIAITSNGGSKDIPVTLTVNPPSLNLPVITDLTPASAPAGIRIKVTGEKFGSSQGQSTLNFDNTSTHVSYVAEIISWSDTTIEAIVPRLAATGKYEVKVIRVSIAAGTGDITALESNPSSFKITAASVAEVATIYPNPFNPLASGVTAQSLKAATIAYNTGSASNVGVYIYDMTARLVYKEVTSAGQITWDGYDQYKTLVGDGVYLVRIVNEDTKTLIAKGKVIVVKR